MSNSIGDLKNSGLKGNNWPWQYRVLLGLDGILTALNNNDEDFEVAYVVERCPGPPPTERVLLEVRTWDASTNTWGTIRYYLPGSNTPIAGPVPAAGCTLDYVDASNIRPLTCADEITVCGTTFTGGSLNTNITNGSGASAVNIQDGGNSITVDAVALDIRPLTCVDKVSLCFNDGVSDVTVSSANPLPVNAVVTVPTPLPVSQDPTSNPWTVDATDLDIRDLTFATDSVDVTGSDVTVSNTVTVQATALDIRPLDCGTDSIKICDGQGNDLVINGVGGPSDGSINSVLIDLTTGNPAVINPDGTQNNAIYGYDNTSLQNEAITSTDISPTVQALDVNVVNNLDCSTDTVAICNGSGNALAIDTSGNINSNLYAYDLVSLAPEFLTTTGSGTSQALDVNIVTPNLAISLGSLVQTGTTGDLSAFSASITSITFQNIGTAVATVSVDGGSNFFPVAPGTSINLDPRIPMGYYNGTSFFWDTTTVGASLLIIYNYI